MSVQVKQIKIPSIIVQQNVFSEEEKIILSPQNPSILALIEFSQKESIFLHIVMFSPFVVY